MQNTETRHLAATIERSGVDEDNRSASLSFSSEAPVDRGSYLEILRHDDESVDLERFRSGAAVLVDHGGDQVGVVESAEVVGDKLRGRIRFGFSERAREVWEDVRAGIRKNVSIGYAILKSVTTKNAEGRRVVTATRWSPHEISITKIPADVSVGIGRSESVTPMSEETKPNTSRRAQRNSAENDRARRITGLAQQFKSVPGAREACDDGIIEGASFEDVLAEVTEAAARAQRNAPTMRLDAQTMTGNDLRGYSISKAILEHCDGTLTGLEAEAHQELSRTMAASTGGILVPTRAFAATRAPWQTTVPGAAAELVEDQLRPGDFIDRLRVKSTYLGLNPTMLSGLVGNAVISKLTGSVSATWEGEVDTVAESNAATTDIKLTPKRLSSHTSFSRLLAKQGQPSVDSLLERDMTEQFASELDRVAFSGSGVDPEPEGVESAAVGSVTLATPGTMTRAEALECEATIAAANADGGRLQFVMPPAMRQGTKGEAVDAGSGAFTWDENDKIVGYAAHSSAHVSANKVLFGDWSQSLFATWGGIELLPDHLTSARSATILLTGHLWCDYAVRHGESFVVAASV